MGPTKSNPHFANALAAISGHSGNILSLATSGFALLTSATICFTYSIESLN